MFRVTKALTLFASTITEQNTIDMVVNIVYTWLGFIARIYVVAYMHMFIRTIFSTSLKYQEIRYQMQEFLYTQKLPKSTHERLLSFYDYHFSNKQFYKRNDIMKMFGRKVHSFYLFNLQSL